MMYENIWERAVLKGRAKNVLSATYWKILAASVIVSFFSSFHFNFYRNLTADYYNSSAGLSSEALKQITAVFLTAVMIAAAFSFIFKISKTVLVILTHAFMPSSMTSDVILL